ncbi:M14 family metallopeptidase [Fictibacillus sp. b24]|uniref:M14 family metallopeptidase n=1 Tax=Fictibacillus sp. b24 TaxID=3055863 RepID=UPI0025A07558|nr:M14 family metallopeptidase [Fictibacillus sp. b24]MDM5317354.1 M14 family metallopeptidase [Fictibacillus sp. b24]
MLGRKKWISSALVLSTIAGLTLSTLEPGFHSESAEASALKIQPLESVSLVQLSVPNNQKALDKLSELGIDLTHRVHYENGMLEVDAVVTPSEMAMLKLYGITVKDTLITERQLSQRAAERRTAIQQEKQLTSAEETVTILRANHFTNQSDTFLYVEAKSTSGATSSTILTAKWTENGAEKTATLQKIEDAGEYLYHSFMLPVTEIPSEVTIESSLGGTSTSKVTEWLGADKPDNPKKHYVKNFVDHYMDPTEINARIENLVKEYPELAEIVEMPNKTNGYRRQAQATIGTMQNAAVVVTSKAWGHEGGNAISLELKKAGAADAPLSVGTSGSKIIVTLATDADGNARSTAKEVVDVLNAEASNLVTATTYRNNAGNGIVEPATANLSDNLKAPASVSREPAAVKAIRIGKHRDGSKPGVLGYSQEHAREWVTPLVSVETAERLLRNYAHDKDTRKLVDNLDIFIIPSMNPDGAHYSFYDFNSQRKNMTNHCSPAQSDSGYRNSWGVDLNRNHNVGSAFDGYVGASTTNCLSGTYAGPSEHSEPESRNLVWLANQNPNIKFAMNIHSYGGYFMWSPGAYTPERETLPRPSAGEEAYYWQASDHILKEIKKHRGTVILPSRTGPIPDVLYSAAGNSADFLWYEKGIYAWNFEVGADLWNKETQRWELVGFQPPFEEGHEEAMEFSNGLLGLIDVAYDYSRDNKAPKSSVTPNGGKYDDTVEVSFRTSEPATIYYTLDGSRPTYESQKLQLSGTREGAETLTFNKTTTLNWFSVDASRNVENKYEPGKNKKYNSKTFIIK